MLLKLDRFLQKNLLDKNITDVVIQIIPQGCAGLKVRVEPMHSDTNLDGYISLESPGGIRCWVEEQYAQKLDHAQISYAKGCYYLVSPHITTRCGCGTSFSFDRKVIPMNMAKLHRLRNALAESDAVKQYSSMKQ